MAGEHFIPFRRGDIVDMCAAEVAELEREPFRRFAAMLSSMLHHRFHERIEALKDAYHPFNPESDTRVLTKLSASQKSAARQRLEEELASLAAAANFTEIDATELETAFNRHSLFKLRLESNLDGVEKVMFYRRGESEQTQLVPKWWGLKKKAVTFTNYARVLVYVALEDRSIIKLFQNVPREDLEMVLPNVRVRMRAIDKWLIGIPAVFSGAVVIATKLVTSLGVVLVLLGSWLGISDQQVALDQTSLVTGGLGLAAFGGYLFRQVTNLKNRKLMFLKALAENLYFRNLDNDAGVFHHLLDAAEEAEVIEAVLAYHFLRLAPATQAELDRSIETWFAKQWDARVDFEVEDGLRKLRDYALVAEDRDGRLSAVPLAEAKQRLDRLWDSLFDASLHVDHVAG